MAPSCLILGKGNEAVLVEYVPENMAFYSLDKADRRHLNSRANCALSIIALEASGFETSLGAVRYAGMRTSAPRLLESSGIGMQIRA